MPSTEFSKEELAGSSRNALVDLELERTSMKSKGHDEDLRRRNIEIIK